MDDIILNAPVIIEDVEFPDQSDLLNLLIELNGDCFFNTFIEYGITCESLKYTNKKHLHEICPKNLFGQRIIFENQLKKWQSNFFSICVQEILNSSGKGSMILPFYQKNLRLNEELRKMLSEIIIEYRVQNKVCASPKIIEHISDGIVNLFQSEVKIIELKKWLQFNVEPMSEIDIDFDYIYPSKGNSLFVNWDQFIVKIIPLMITNIKVGNSKLLLKPLVEIEETDIETRNHLVLDLMNAILVPTSKSFEIDPVTNKRRIVKTSISDAKTSFLLQVVSVNDLHV
ncbi:Uncharacterized protein FWK35_00032757 [Aphis craccivora]|uniref:Uncharacterized protein n=1 Tax=Aphis craccivora TaxID=307492 RepID=A0A6G0X0C8_APHCR|nr:Uncharacterized protein FWK35_00032757 [Aphis craccivora]